MIKLEEVIDFINGFAEEITVNLLEDNRFAIGAFDIKRNNLIEKLRSYGDKLCVTGIGSREFYVQIGNSQTTIQVSNFEFDDIDDLPLN